MTCNHLDRLVIISLQETRRLTILLPTGSLGIIVRNKNKKSGHRTDRTSVICMSQEYSAKTEIMTQQSK